MALLLKANGTREEISVEGLTIKKVQSLIQGDVELVPSINSEGVRTHLLLVNDEARLSGLPYNLDASQAVGMTILGDAVLLTVEEAKKVLEEE